MSFWQTLETTSRLGVDLTWITVAFAVISLILTWALPNDRTRVRAAVALFLVAMIALLFASWLPENFRDATGKLQEAFAHRWTRAAALFCISAAMVTVAGVLIFDVILTSIRLKPPAILCDILLACAYIATALLVLSNIGVDVSGIVATSAVVTAVIGFSLQDTLGNIMGGMAIQMERSITVGDWIQVGDTIGLVKEIRWRQTSIETSEWDTVVIPNSVLMKSQVTVRGRRTRQPRQHRSTILFNVDYRHPPSDVINTVTAAIVEDPIPNIAPEPKPYCGLAKFMDSYASYSLRYWRIDEDLDDATDSQVRCRIYYALKRMGISIAIPAYRTFQTEESVARRDRIVTENLAKRLAAISQVDIFQPLNDEERQRLADRLKDCPFARGEAMARQGTQAECMFIITSGRAEVFVQVAGANSSKMVASLGVGDFFGEMGLMTGDLRAATVVASSEVHCFRLDKDAFHDILNQRPEIAEAISQILARRRVELEAVREHLAGEAMKNRLANTQGDLLARIRKFFTLDRASK